MASPEICGRQGGHEQLLVLPVVGLARPDLPPADGAQLPGLRFDHFAPRDVLDGLQKKVNMCFAFKFVGGWCHLKSLWLCKSS